MDNKRAETLEALSAFIQNQKTFLERTQSDIDRLKELKTQALAEPGVFLSNLSHELNAEAFKLSDLLECAAGRPEDIDWSLYASQDPTPLRTLTVTTRLSQAQRNQPHSSQRSDLSELQRTVKEARQTLLDPVFASLSPLSSDSESESEIDQEELKREREKEKIRQLKKRKIGCGLTVPSFMFKKERESSGVFIRRDQEDESAEVDISDREIDHGAKRKDGMAIVRPAPMDVDMAASPVASTHPTPPSSAPAMSMALPNTCRARRPSSRLKFNELNATGPQAKRHATCKLPPNDTKVASPLPQATKKRSRDAGKPKPETYKQAWSVSEQHLLEQLLEEIPDGEKNRWQKISLAMDGKRTPRQVASRVQKYFEKLKRFGVGVHEDEAGGE